MCNEQRREGTRAHAPVTLAWCTRFHAAVSSGVAETDSTSTRSAGPANGVLGVDGSSTASPMLPAPRQAGERGGAMTRQRDVDGARAVGVLRGIATMTVREAALPAQPRRSSLRAPPYVQGRVVSEHAERAVLTREWSP